MSSRPFRVLYHYNKPASLSAGCPKLTVHFKGVCHIVDHIKCLIPTESHHQSHQPRCVIRGMSRDVQIVRDPQMGQVAIIT